MAQKCTIGHCRNNKAGSCSKTDSELKDLTKNGASLGVKGCPGFKSKLP